MPRTGTLDVAAALTDAAPRAVHARAPSWELADAEFLQVNWEVDDDRRARADPARRCTRRSRRSPSFFAGRYPDTPVGTVLRWSRSASWSGPASARGRCASARCATTPRPSRRCASHWGYPVAARRGRGRRAPRPVRCRRRGRRARRRGDRAAHGRRHQRQRPDDVRQPPPGAPRRAAEGASSCRSTPSTRSTRPTAAGPRVSLPDPEALGMRGRLRLARADHRLHVPRRHRPRAGPLPDRRRQAGDLEHRAGRLTRARPGRRVRRRRAARRDEPSGR